MSEPSTEDSTRDLEELRRRAERERTQRVVAEAEVGRLKAELGRLEERTQFHEELTGRVRSAHERMEIIASMTKELASFDLDQVVGVALERIPYLVGARFASLYVYDAGEDRLLLRDHNHGRVIDPLVSLDEHPGSLMAQAVRRREVLCIDDLGNFVTAEGEAPVRPHQAAYSTTSCVVVPLLAGGEVMGVLNLADRFDQRPFDSGEEELKFVRLACELVAVSLRNAHLFEAVERAARVDALTGLLNRQAFMETLHLEIQRAKRYGHRLALAVCRLSGLRLINANFGHQAGDAVIKRAAALVRGNVRDVDVAGRTGGNELALILPEQAREGALTVAQRLADMLAGSGFEVDGTPCEVRGTIGVAVYEEQEASELVDGALQVLINARAAGLGVGIKPE